MSWRIRFSIRLDFPVPVAPMIYVPSRRSLLLMVILLLLEISVPRTEEVIGLFLWFFYFAFSDKLFIILPCDTVFFAKFGGRQFPGSYPVANSPLIKFQFLCNIRNSEPFSFLIGHAYPHKPLL